MKIFHFYNFNPNWNVSTNFTKNSKYEFARKSEGGSLVVSFGGRI